MLLKIRQINKPIFTSLSPNTEKDDILLALSLIVKPWTWKSFSLFQRHVQHSLATTRLENKLKEYLGIKYAVTFNSGRSSFLAILKCLNLEPNSEILIQGFTCNAVVNPILTAGLKPIFVDIDEKTLNINPDDLERKISGKSRAVVVQHTFGLPADINKILEICQKHNLIPVEDCAHSLGTKYLAQGEPINNTQGKLVGTFGKASFFSFGRDKVISSVSGGIAVTNNDQLAQKLKEYQNSLPQPSYHWILQQILHPILINLIVMPLYNLGEIGRWKLIALQKIGLLSKAVSKKEKQGGLSPDSGKKMPDALAMMALNQFAKLEKFISHQYQIAKFYDENLAGIGLALPSNADGRIYLRYPLLLKNLDTDKILDKARKQKIFLDDGWRKSVIVPPDTNQEKMGYRAGDCPVAERVAENIINLPTHINISEQKAHRIINFLKTELQK